MWQVITEFKTVKREEMEPFGIPLLMVDRLKVEPSSTACLLVFFSCKLTMGSQNVENLKGHDLDSTTLLQ